MRAIWSCLCLVLLSWGLVSCGDRLETPQLSGTEKVSQTALAGKLSEVATPPALQQLRQSLEQYQPQVTILSPQADQVFQDTTVSLEVQVRDLPIFKDPELQMGPHLQVILDNQPYRAVYDVEQPIVFEDLSPGTHTLRVFASRPWHESFKNEGAYAQTTFHIFAKTDDNTPAPSLPLLTYSSPKGSYGAEPIMLDFYLTNAPLHLVAQENPEDEIADWRIRVTVNGQSFLLDSWQPVYLKGFDRGQNWVQLEFLDEQGNKINNVFNNTVRLITYQPKGQDTLSKLIRGELSAEAARGIIDPNYKAKLAPVPSPTPTPTPTVEETPSEELVEPEEALPPTVEETPAAELETPSEELIEPEEALPPTVEETPTAELETPSEELAEPEKALPPTVEETPTAELETPSEELAEPSQALASEKPKSSTLPEMLEVSPSESKVEPE